MTAPDVTVQLAGHVAIVEIHRPPNNFFDTALIKGIADAYERLDDDVECRAIVLCAEGRHFCAGADLSSGANTFDRDARRFMFLANRFRWEGGARPAAADGGFERILCGVAFDEVTAVSYRGFRRADAERLLSLLAIRPADGVIDLEFAAGAAVRLDVARIACRLRDVGEPYPTAWLPDHDQEPPA